MIHSTLQHLKMQFDLLDKLSISDYVKGESYFMG